MTRRAWLFFIALWFWLIETHHFGWNMAPQSDAEMICDGIAMLLLSIAISYRDKAYVLE